MKLTFTHQTLTAIAVALASVIPFLPVRATTFDQQEVEQRLFIAIARPYGNKFDLLILQQIPGKQQCWRESGSNPVIIEPLLLNFDFTGSCERSTDSNGYSLRVDGQDYGLDYLLRIVERNGELVLVGTHRTNAQQAEIIVGRTHGLSQNFLKIDLNPGWRFTKRSYGGQLLGHIYLTGESSAMTSPQPRTTAVTPAASETENSVRELTFTADDSSISPSPRQNPSELTATTSNSPSPNPLPPLPSPRQNPSESPLTNGGSPSPSPRQNPSELTATTNSDSNSPSPNPLPPPPSPRQNPSELTATTNSDSNSPSPNPLPPPPSPRQNSSELPSFSELPPLDSPVPTNNNDVVPPPPPNAEGNYRKSLSEALDSLSNADSTDKASISSATSSYRVMVSAKTNSQQTQVRSLYPDAFPTSYNGRSLWQVGRFSSRENAQQAQQSLENVGLSAIIVP